MNKYWSDLAGKLAPYEPGEQPQDNVYIKLNTNENPYPPSPRALQEITETVSDGLRLYPDPEAVKLKQAIASYYSVSETCVFTGNGSDEVLALAFMAFFKDRSDIAFPDITYSFYPVYCKLFEIDFCTFPLNAHFEIDVNAIPDTSGGIIFPNPNAPTGIALDLEQIESLLRKFSERVVIIDEAYIDFGGRSAVELTGSYPNLLVIQTLSKSRSLAGMRVGYAIGHEDLISALNRVKNSFNSYPLDALAIAGAVAAIQDREHFADCCRKIIDTREWLSEQLGELSFEVLPSSANFVFARHPRQNAGELYRQLKQRGILVRHFDKPGIDDFLRITIGTNDDMARFCDTLRAIMDENT